MENTAKLYNENEYRHLLNRTTKYISRKLGKFEKNVTRDNNLHQSLPLTPPLEHYLKIPQPIRVREIHSVLKVHSLVIGRVIEVTETNIVFELLHIYSSCSRKVFDLNIRFFIPVKSFSRDLPEVSEFYKAVIVKCDTVSRNNFIEATVNQFSLPKNFHDIFLGKVSVSDISDYLLKFKNEPTFESYISELCSNSDFFNLTAIKYMEQSLDLDPSRSFDSFILQKSTKTTDSFDDLRKQQLVQYSKKLTRKAVEYIRKGSEANALNYLNKALESNPENVDAIVALGACKANNKKFTEAINLFENALKIQPDHPNALNYIVETTISLSQTYEKKKQWLDAIDCYSKIISLPNLPRASTLQDKLKTALSCANMVPNTDSSKNVNNTNNASQGSKDSNIIKQTASEVKNDKINEMNSSIHPKEHSNTETQNYSGTSKCIKVASISDNKKLKHLTSKDLELVNSILKRK